MQRFKILISLFITVFLVCACAGTGGSKQLTAEGLFLRHVEASFGKAGMDAHTSVTQKGTMFIEDFGMEAPIVTKAMAPGYMVFETNVMGMDMSQGCNMEGCWGQQPGQGVSDLSGEILDFTKQQADYDQWENITEYYETLEIVPEEDPNAENYTVKGTNKYGRENLYYFSKESGLLVGITITADSEMGVVTQSTNLLDYQDFGGVLWPKTMEQNTPMATVKIVIDEVSYDPLTESSFARPN